MANGVYWIGQDGKTYIKANGIEGGAQQWRAPLKTPQQMGLTRIDDPVNPTRREVSTSPAPAGGSSGGGAAVAEAPVLNQAGVDNTQRTIDELPGLLEAALRAERQRYQNSLAEFNKQETGQRKTYDESTTTNQLNYDSNFMDSIRAGIKGLGGLMNLLRGTGAGGGTVEDEVRDTVGGVTAGDIRVGADTRKENQSSLDTSLSAFLDELGRKRRVNEDTVENNERAIRRDNDTQMQELFGKMAGFYSDAGDRNRATEWMNRAGELTPRIAKNSRTQVSPYDTTPVVVKAPELAAFAEPTQPSIVTAPDGQVGSGIFTMTDPRRRKEPTAPLLPVGV